MPSPQTIPEICAALEKQGHPDLAQRIAYFASDEDLEEGGRAGYAGKRPGVLGVFQRGGVGGAISNGLFTAEGQICADWKFDDHRLVALWFLDFDQVKFAASYAPRKWVEIDGGGEVGSRIEVTERLVEAGLFTWQLDHPVNKNLVPSTMLPDTAEVDI